MEIRDNLKNNYAIWEKILNDCLTEFKLKGTDEHSIIGLAAVTRDNDGCCSDEINISEDFVNYIKYLVKSVCWANGLEPDGPRRRLISGRQLNN